MNTEIDPLTMTTELYFMNCTSKFYVMHSRKMQQKQQQIPAFLYLSSGKFLNGRSFVDKCQEENLSDKMSTIC